MRVGEVVHDPVTCTACAGRELANPHCVSCARLTLYMHHAIALKVASLARVDAESAAQGLRWGLAGAAMIFGVVMLLAALGVRNPLAYVVIIAAQNMIGLVATSVGKTNLERRRDARVRELMEEVRGPIITPTALVDATRRDVVEMPAVPPERPE